MINKEKYSLFAVLILAFTIAGIQLLPAKEKGMAITSYNLKTDNRYLSANYHNEELGLSSLSLIQGNTIKAYSSPRGINDSSFASQSYNYESQLINYVVRPGDTIESIAEEFGVSEKTILWANDIEDNDDLKVNKKLTILPVTGALHLVRPGDSLSQIAELYKSDMDQIASFNQIGESDIYIGDLLIVPYGEKPKQLPVNRWALASTFIIPTEGYITQTLHPYNAIDVANNCGTPIYATAGGTVQRTGWVYRGGRRIRILHNNGVVTYYGHLSQILVSPGQHISQGQLIGRMGNNGVSTGCHLHYDVRGARNNLSSYQLGQEISY